MSSVPALDGWEGRWSWFDGHDYGHAPNEYLPFVSKERGVNGQIIKAIKNEYHPPPPSLPVRSKRLRIDEVTLLQRRVQPCHRYNHGRSLIDREWGAKRKKNLKQEKRGKKASVYAQLDVGRRGKN